MNSSQRRTRIQQEWLRGWRHLLLIGTILIVSACGLVLPVGPDYVDIRAHALAEAHYFDPH